MCINFYNSLVDTLIQANMELLNPAYLAKKILPFLFMGGDDEMMQLYQDSITIV